MSILTSFQVVRHKCAKLYCPKDWTINLWADFFGDCCKVVAEDKEDDEEWMNSLYKCYDVPKELVENVIKFINENIDSLR